RDTPSFPTRRSSDLTESEIIGNLYAQTLEDAGVEVETQFNVGSREAYIPALADGSIDVIPEYTGNLLLFRDRFRTGHVRLGIDRSEEHTSELQSRFD